MECGLDICGTYDTCTPLIQAYTGLGDRVHETSFLTTHPDDHEPVVALLDPPNNDIRPVQTMAGVVQDDREERYANLHEEHYLGWSNSFHRMFACEQENAVDTAAPNRVFASTIPSRSRPEPSLCFELEARARSLSPSTSVPTLTPTSTCTMSGCASHLDNSRMVAQPDQLQVTQPIRGTRGSRRFRPAEENFVIGLELEDTYTYVDASEAPTVRPRALSSPVPPKLFSPPGHWQLLRARKSIARSQAQTTRV